LIGSIVVQASEHANANREVRTRRSGHPGTAEMEYLTDNIGAARASQ
jgi:hypothetical protein